MEQAPEVLAWVATTRHLREFDHWDSKTRLIHLKEDHPELNTEAGVRNAHYRFHSARMTRDAQRSS